MDDAERGRLMDDIFGAISRAGLSRWEREEWGLGETPSARDRLDYMAS